METYTYLYISEAECRVLYLCSVNLVSEKLEFFPEHAKECLCKVDRFHLLNCFGRSETLE